jgi:hypothetical protein
MESAEKQTQLSRSFHRPLGISQRRRDSHIPTTLTTCVSPKPNTTPLASLPIQLNSLRVGHFRWPKWARARGQTQTAIPADKRAKVHIAGLSNPAFEQRCDRCHCVLVPRGDKSWEPGTAVAYFGHGHWSRLDPHEASDHSLYRACGRGTCRPVVRRTS